MGRVSHIPPSLPDSAVMFIPWTGSATAVLRSVFPEGMPRKGQEEKPTLQQSAGRGRLGGAWGRAPSKW